MEGTGFSDEEGHPADRPRIRQITGIRIHQLTLPESLPLAAKLIPDSPHSPLPSPSIEYHSQAGPSSPSLRRSLSGTVRSRKERRISTSTIPESPRDRSTLPPPHHDRPVRGNRPRAPTLAGEALEHAHSQPSVGDGDHVQDQLGAIEETEVRKRRLARSFVVMKIPRPPPPPSMIKSRPTKSQDDTDKPRSPSRPNGLIRSRTSSSASSSPPSSPVHRSSSRSSLGPRSDSKTNVKQLRTATSPNPKRPPTSRPPSASSVPRELPLSRTLSSKSSRQTRLTISTTTPSTPSSVPSPNPCLSSNVPFFISSIHHPSTHPRFLSLSPETDFAPWLTIEESASHTVEVEVWYEATEGWTRFKEIEESIDLGKLKRRESNEDLGDNFLEFTFSTDARGVYYVPRAVSKVDQPADEGAKDIGIAKSRKTSVRGIVERSMRETRMKKGIGVGGLHQLVNIQSVLIDTQRGIEAVRGTVDELLLDDVNRSALKRDVEERSDRSKWIREKIEEVEKSMREVQAHITLRQQAMDERIVALRQAEEQSELLRGKTIELHTEISAIDIERAGLLALIHHYRTNHVQTLDTIFPILPLHPPTLLYSILGVPLPIPTDPKDPAPPLTLPPASLQEGSPKVDERTTAAALGYVAMVVNLLGTLGGPMGGLAYPITCAGSRSLVKDVVSVMQGPRSFPLYAKGVERYRFEYAVFLLNKNIEMLMQESNIRLLDLRHTLPNLKILLLTLSSPVQPSSSSHLAVSRSTTYVNSVTSSRQTSAAWPRPYASPGPASTYVGPGSIGSPGSSKGSIALGGSPVQNVERRHIRRSGLRRSMGGGGEVDLGSDEEDEEGDDESIQGAQVGAVKVEGDALQSPRRVGRI